MVEILKCMCRFVIELVTCPDFQNTCQVLAGIPDTPGCQGGWIGEKRERPITVCRNSLFPFCF